MITSKSNSKVKNIRKLTERKYRELNNLFYIEGVRIIAEALACNWYIKEVIVSPELIRDGFSLELLDKIRKTKIQILEVDSAVFKSISIKDGPKGLAAVVYRNWGEVSTIIEKKGLWIALDRIQDPGNLGTIMRTADAVGATGIILIDHCTDPFDITSVRASMGALFSLSIIKCENNEFIKLVKDNNLFLIGTSDRGATDYRKIKYSNDTIILMGSEREGLSPELIKTCDDLVFIPMSGKSDSLNIAVATAVCLFEIHNQFHPIT
jgi:TrmH family RNA methyltransferase